MILETVHIAVLKPEPSTIGKEHLRFLCLEGEIIWVTDSMEIPSPLAATYGGSLVLVRVRVCV